VKRKILSAGRDGGKLSDALNTTLSVQRPTLDAESSKTVAFDACRAVALAKAGWMFRRLLAIYRSSALATPKLLA
jgi:hypothetical protein